MCRPWLLGDTSRRGNTRLRNGTHALFLDRDRHRLTTDAALPDGTATRALLDADVRSNERPEMTRTRASGWPRVAPATRVRTVPHQSRVETRASHRPGKFRSSRETGAPRRSARARGAGTRASTRTAAMEARRAEAELERRRADALLTACDLGLTDDVAALIAGGATFEATDKAGVRPMTFAAARGHADVVELPCSHGVDANDDDALGRAPLHFAAMHGRARVARARVPPGHVGGPADHLDDTPLTLAARRRRRDDRRVARRRRGRARAKQSGTHAVGRGAPGAAQVRPRGPAAGTRGWQTDRRASGERLERRRGAFGNQKKGVRGSFGDDDGGARRVVARRRRRRVRRRGHARVAPDKGVDVDAVLAAGEVGTKRSANASMLRNQRRTRRTNGTASPASVSARGAHRDAGENGARVGGDAGRETVRAGIRGSTRGVARAGSKGRARAGGGETRFLQKLVDDDEFQEDMALSHTRDAVDAVVGISTPSRACRRRARRRVLEKFGSCSASQGARVQDHLRGRAWRTPRRRRRGAGRWASSERADAALAGASRHARGAAGFRQTPPRSKAAPGSNSQDRRVSKPARSPVARECARSRHSAAGGPVARGGDRGALRRAARLGARAPRVREGWFFSRGTETTVVTYVSVFFYSVRSSLSGVRRPHFPGTASSSKESTNARSTTGACADASFGCFEEGEEVDAEGMLSFWRLRRPLGPASPPTLRSASATSRATSSVSTESPRLGKPLHSW